jgi:hypothetical protein
MVWDGNSDDFFGFQYDQGLAALGDAFEAHETLFEVNITGNEISAAQAERFNQIMQRNNQLTTLCGLSHTEQYLDWRCQSLSAGCGVLLSAAIKSCLLLSRLDLSCNSIDDDGATALANSVRTHPRIKWLDLSSNCIGDGGCAAMCFMIANHARLAGFPLEHVNLLHNEIGINAAIEFGRVAGTKAIKLTRFDGHESAINLTYAASGGYKESSRRLQAGCAVLICQEMDNRGGFLTLMHLDLANNNLGPQGAEAIANAITKRPSAPLKVLSISTNNIIGKEAGEAIASLLRHNTNLLELDLSHNQNHDFTLNAFDFARELAAGLAENTTLLNLDLQNNMIGQLVLPAGWCEVGEREYGYRNMGAAAGPAWDRHRAHQQHPPNGAFESTGVQLLVDVLGKPCSALQSINLLGNCMREPEAKRLGE